MPAKGQRTGYYIKCECCGKDIYQTKTQYNRAKHHFCSNKCQKEYEHKIKCEDRKCEICGKVFNVGKQSTKRFCSIQCQGKWQSMQTGNLNPRRNRISCKCDNCGKDLEIIESNYVRFKNHFCNDECRKTWYSNVYSQSEEWKDVSRKRAVKILNKRKQTTNTKPQRIINELLDNLSIKYENEKEYTYYSVDNYLPEYNLIIEVMGDFWHGSPIKYSHKKLNDIQKKCISRDKAKHTYIKNKYGIEILYIWESDIYNNTELCKHLILQYINNNGILNNYNSFNYHNDNGDVYVNKDIIYPYQEIKIA